MTNEKKSCNWNIVKCPYKQFSHSTNLYEIEREKKGNCDLQSNIHPNILFEWVKEVMKHLMMGIK